MNERDKTAQMMQDSSGQHWGTEAHFQRFAALVRADEREACAKVCEQGLPIASSLSALDDMEMWGEKFAVAIRARGNT
jgi:hypothetical protein